MKEADYYKLQEKQKKEWESLCVRCGACCGAEEDPCEYLQKDKKGLYFCVIYDNRFGRHKTVGGSTLKCVPLRKIIHESWPGDAKCAYKKALSAGG